MPKPGARTQFLIASIIFFAVLIACGSTSKPSQGNIDDLVKNRLGNQYTTSYNSSRSYALFHQSPGGDHINRSFKYVVVKIADHKITNEGSYKNGYVKWIDDNTIEVASSGMDEKFDKKIIQVGSQKS